MNPSTSLMNRVEMLMGAPYAKKFAEDYAYISEHAVVTEVARVERGLEIELQRAVMNREPVDFPDSLMSEALKEIVEKHYTDMRLCKGVWSKNRQDIPWEETIKHLNFQWGYEA